MAFAFGTFLRPTTLISSKIPKRKSGYEFPSSSCPKALSGGSQTDQDPPEYSAGPSSSSAQTQLNLLEQLTGTGYEIDGDKQTIRQQLANLVGDREGNFSIQLGKNLKKVTPKFLTTSQRRNIRRQDYLNQVSKRNDSVFFATIGAFVILPPVVILGIAIATGYVQLFP